MREPRIQVWLSTAFRGSWFLYCPACHHGAWVSSAAAAGDAGRRHLRHAHNATPWKTPGGYQGTEPRGDRMPPTTPSASSRGRAPLIGGHPCTPTGP